MVFLKTELTLLLYYGKEKAKFNPLYVTEHCLLGNSLALYH